MIIIYIYMKTVHRPTRPRLAVIYTDQLCIGSFAADAKLVCSHFKSSIHITDQAILSLFDMS